MLNVCIGVRVCFVNFMYNCVCVLCGLCIVCVCVCESNCEDILPNKIMTRGQPSKVRHKVLNIISNTGN